MTVLNMVYIPDDVLTQTAVDVGVIDQDIKTLLQDMADTMYEYQGIGLAANQVGVLKRVIVVDVADPDAGEETNLIKMVNPKILSFSDEKHEYEEGCLSIPGGRGLVERPDVVEVEYLDENGQTHRLTADGLLSTCIQHEIDHLDGILFIDYLSRLKRSMIIKKVAKLLASR